MSKEFLDCLKRERDISFKPFLSGVKTAFRCTPALNHYTTTNNPLILNMSKISKINKKIPNETKACKKILLIQPRVFSLLENSFWDNQACAMEDYIEATIMLQYHQRWSHKGNTCLYNPPYKHIKRSYFILGKKNEWSGEKILSIIVELFEHKSKSFWA